jgi:putative transcriptional regulator
MLKSYSAEELFNKPLTRKQKAEIRAVEQMRDEDIDTSDIPERIPDRGEIIRGKDMVHPGPVDVKAIRTGLGLSQALFAVRFGFNVRTVQDWESSGVQPPVHVRAYLIVISRIPKAVANALKGAA